jgi:hypothetical protein
LISNDELWQQYKSNPASMIFEDTRQEWEYRPGHIQGADNFPMEPTWLFSWGKKGDLEVFLGADRNRQYVFIALDWHESAATGGTYENILEWL